MPLCRKVAESIFHMILNCDFVNNVWIQAQPLLLSLHRKPITDEEKTLGMVTIKRTTGIMLRNWVTYKLREQVMLFERKASKSSKLVSLDIFKARFNQSMAREIKQHLFRYKNENNLPTFDKIIAYQGILCDKVREGEYRFKLLFG